MDKNFWKAAIAMSVAGGLYVLLDAIWLEQYFFEVRHFHIGRRHSNRVIRMIHLSDLHFKETFFSFQKRLARKINDLRPDLLFLTGDAIDEDAQSSTAVRRFLGMLGTDYKKIAVPGNHDHKSNVSFDELRLVYEQHGVDLLINESRQLQMQGRKLTITGLDDFIEGDACFRDAVKGLGSEENHILLIHSPKQQEFVLQELEQINSNRDETERLKLQYIFAGHNHGGQVRLPTYVPVLPEHSGNYVNGWYNDKPPFLYISKGFGTTAVPFRFMARAEMAVFHYHL